MMRCPPVLLLVALLLLGATPATAMPQRRVAPLEPNAAWECDDGTNPPFAPVVCMANNNGLALRCACAVNERQLPPAVLQTLVGDLAPRLAAVETAVSSLSTDFFNCAACQPCIPTPEVCDGRDNDCDLLVDEDFDLSGDPNHCGACGNVCEAGQLCVGGACQTPAPTCTDSIRNGFETGVDCGGPDCPACPNGEGCAAHSDCDTGCCSAGVCGGSKTTYYRDQDADGHGNPSDSTLTCSPPAGYVTDNTDCDDTVSTVYPSAPEICDSRDNDCDGVIDEDIDLSGDPNHCGACGNVCPSGQFCVASFCQSPTCTDSIRNGFETGVDCGGPDCPACPNGEGCAAHSDCDTGCCSAGVCGGSKTTYYRDLDADGYGNPSDSTLACSPPPGYVTDDTDCDDTSSRANPSQTAFFSQSITPGGGFDYNCDSVEEKQDDTVAFCVVVFTSGVPTGCTLVDNTATLNPTSSGWLAAAPGCGVTAQYLTSAADCTMTPAGGSFVCLPSGSVMIQSCR